MKITNTSNLEIKWGKETFYHVILHKLDEKDESSLT